MCSEGPSVHLFDHSCSLRAHCVPRIDLQWMQSYVQACNVDHFDRLNIFWSMKRICFYSTALCLTPTAQLPPSSPSLWWWWKFSIWELWWHGGCILSSARVVPSMESGWIEMEGGPVSHATRLVAILTPVCLCAWVGGRVVVALVFLHTLAV